MRFCNPIFNVKDCPGTSFLRASFDCMWLTTHVGNLQGLGLLLALLLRAIGPHQYYDSDDDYDAARAPLLNAAHPRYVVGDPVYGSKK